MIAQKGLEIKNSNLFYYEVYTKDKSDWYTFPHWAVVRDFSEEEIEELTMEEVCELLGREIKIKK